jgi:hypothetical protein
MPYTLKFPTPKNVLYAAIAVFLVYYGVVGIWHNVP